VVRGAALHTAVRTSWSLSTLQEQMIINYRTGREWLAER
jgi:hypothetical protein